MGMAFEEPTALATIAAEPLMPPLGLGVSNGEGEHQVVADQADVYATNTSTCFSLAMEQFVLHL